MLHCWVKWVLSKLSTESSAGSVHRTVNWFGSWQLKRKQIASDCYGGRYPHSKKTFDIHEVLQLQEADATTVSWTNIVSISSASFVMLCVCFFEKTLRFHFDIFRHMSKCQIWTDAQGPQQLSSRAFGNVHGVLAALASQLHFALETVPAASCRNTWALMLSLDLHCRLHTNNDRNRVIVLKGGTKCQTESEEHQSKRVILFYFQDILRAHIVQSRSNSKDCQEVPDGCREMDLQDERADDGLDAKWIAGIVLG